MRLLRILSPLLVLSVVSMTAGASDVEVPEAVRPVSAWYTVQAGSAAIDDTYLTMVSNSGWHTALGYERMQVMDWGGNQPLMQINCRLNLDRTHPKWSTSALWGANLVVDWALLKQFSVSVRGLKVYGGGVVHADLGALYIDRGGNNPADAKCAVTFGATALGSYNFRLGRLPLTVSYQPSLQLVGACFAQQYDEPYYEIYLGNHSGLAHCATPFNRLDLSNSVNIDLRFGSTVVRVGYRSDILSSKINHIVTNRVTNSFVIGLGGQWLSAPVCSGPGDDARIISAIY